MLDAAGCATKRQCEERDVHDVFRCVWIGVLGLLTAAVSFIYIYIYGSNV